MEKVSIYIPVFNAEKTISYVIDAIENQTVKFDEIIIVNDCSTDHTKKIINQHTHIKKINNHYNRGLGYCRNIAIKNTKNEIVAGIDADVVLDKNWLENIMQDLKGNTMICGGNLIEKNIKNKYNEWRSIYYKQNWGNKSLEGPPFLYGCNTIQKKTAWAIMGGYDEQLKTNGEDIDYCNRLKDNNNYRTFYNANAKCYHLQDDDLDSLSRRVWRYHSYGYKVKKPSIYRFIKLIIKQFKFFFIRVMSNLTKKKSKFFFINLLILINFIKLELKRTIDNK